MNKLKIIITVFTITALLIISQTIGIFVIEPIGAVPEGKTLIYVRYGYVNMKFIDSIDAMVKRSGEPDNIWTRLACYSALGKIIEDKTVIRLPYSETLHNLSK